MLELSADREVADKQMQAVIFYLVTFGHVDGDFDISERTFIRQYIGRLVEHWIRQQTARGLEASFETAVAGYTARFHQMLESIDLQVHRLFNESVSYYEASESFIHSRLKLRCYEVLGQLDKGSQGQLMKTLDELLMADGEAHPAELKFRAELARLLDADVSVELAATTPPKTTRIAPAIVRASNRALHPFFDELEHVYSSDARVLREQIDNDRKVLQRVLKMLEKLRDRGSGMLRGKKTVDELFGEPLLLDGYVWALGESPDRRCDLTVLGDLHGCYSCLKAALIQSRFFEKVEAYRKDPKRQPFPQLVLLGDYIDRGNFGLSGVLRTVLRLYCQMPDHVVMLRGNHEDFVEYQGSVHSTVKPSETLDDLNQRASPSVARDYLRLFQALPTVYLFGRICFVHGGVPCDRTFRRQFSDLASLNHPDVRLQMMWSDPTSCAVVPADLQEQSARFCFGRLQALRFLQQIGCNTLIRGHEMINEGFRVDCDDASLTLLTVFSSGGESNADLPADSGYRGVVPMALTLEHGGGQSTVTPWTIDYQPYNDPERNGFFRGRSASVGSHP
jgi:hypothetical protein